MPPFPQNGVPPHSGGRQNGRGQVRAAPNFAPSGQPMPQPAGQNAPRSAPQAAVAAMHSIFNHPQQNPQAMSYAEPAPNFIQTDNSVPESYIPAQPPQQRQPAPPHMPQDTNLQNAQSRPREQSREASLAPARFFRAERSYGREEAFSCCFRQWQAANSRRQFLHGYGLSFVIAFVAQDLDRDGQIIDSAALKPIQAWLQKNFDHKVLLAADDPARPVFQNLAQAGLCDLRIMPYISCEAFAYFVWQNADAIARQASRGRVRAESVTARERGGDAASFKADNLFPSA